MSMVDASRVGVVFSIHVGVFSLVRCHIPVNRPESGGTVPIFAAMSRCPA